MALLTFYVFILLIFVAPGVLAWLLSGNRELHQNALPPLGRLVALAAAGLLVFVAYFYLDVVPPPQSTDSGWLIVLLPAFWAGTSAVFFLTACLFPGGTVSKRVHAAAFVYFVVLGALTALILLFFAIAGDERDVFGHPFRSRMQVATAFTVVMLGVVVVAHVGFARMSLETVHLPGRSGTVGH